MPQSGTASWFLTTDLQKGGLNCSQHSLGIKLVIRWTIAKDVFKFLAHPGILYKYIFKGIVFVLDKSFSVVLSSEVVIIQVLLSTCSHLTGYEMKKLSYPDSMAIEHNNKY